MYRASSFLSNPQRINQQLSKGLYRYEAIPPEMPWLKVEAPAAPRLRYHIRGDSLELNWDKSEKSDYYLIYLLSNEKEIDQFDAQNIIAKQRGCSVVLPIVEGDSHYAITRLNRVHGESQILIGVNTVSTNPDLIQN